MLSTRMTSLALPLMAVATLGLVSGYLIGKRRKYESDGEEKTNKDRKVTIFSTNPIEDPACAAHWEFSLSLMKLTPNTNVIYSPLSLGIVLVSLMNGSKGQTQEQIRRLLGYDTTVEQVTKFYSSIYSIFTTKSNDIYSNIPINIGSVIFYDERFVMHGLFADLVGKKFNVEGRLLNFGDRRESAMIANDFVSELTDGKMTNAFMESDFSSLKSAIVFNTVLFKPLWMDPFDADESYRGTFHGLNGNRKQKFMRDLTFVVPFYIDDNLSALSIPFEHDGGHFFAIKPSADFERFVATLTADRLREIAHAMKPDSHQGLKMTVPKFSVETKFDAVPTLKRLGVDVCFDAGSADLTGMTSQEGMYVGGISQQATIDVHENGVEASAGTSSGINMGPPPPRIDLDKPFVYFLVQHDVIVFVGRFV